MTLELSKTGRRNGEIEGEADVFKFTWGKIIKLHVFERQFQELLFLFRFETLCFVETPLIRQEGRCVQKRCGQSGIRFRSIIDKRNRLSALCRRPQKGPGFFLDLCVGFRVKIIGLGEEDDGGSHLFCQAVYSLVELFEFGQLLRGKPADHELQIPGIHCHAELAFSG